MKEQNQILITKASGENVVFSESKLRSSLLRAGASEEQITIIVAQISEKLYDGISTQEIYRMAFNLLKQGTKRVAAKYQLKRAIMELGPSGFPFEKYIAEILKTQGYRVKVGEIVRGQCVNHEIDVIAEKGEQHFMIECKYHNQPGTVCDVKIPLYIQARFKDVEAAWVKIPGHGTKFHQGWVVTNTRFTIDALQYGNCAGLNLLGWDYPHGNSLRNQIDKLKLYPITCLTTLTQAEKQTLLDKRIVLCKELCEDDRLLLDCGIIPSRIKSIMKEALELCEHLYTSKTL